MISTSLEACSTPELKSQNRVAILLQNLSISLSFVEFTGASERSSLDTAKVTPSKVSAGFSRHALSLGPGLIIEHNKAQCYINYISKYSAPHTYAYTHLFLSLVKIACMAIRLV